MMEHHLTANAIEQCVENELDAAQRRALEAHLAVCAECRVRLARAHRLTVTLRALPREQPARALAARIEARVVQEQTRRARLPFVAAATLIALFVAAWFCVEFGIALQESGVLAFWTLLTSYSEFFSSDWLDSLIALLEAVPLTELFLTLCALLTAGILAQQLVESLRPRAMQWQ